MTIPQSVKLVYTYFGSGVGLGAYGPQEEIDMVLNSLYNHKGHNDITRYLSHNFGYVLTDKKSLLIGIKNAIVTRLINDRIMLTRAERNGVWEQAETEAQEIFDNIKHESFLTGSTPAKEYEVPKNLWEKQNYEHITIYHLPLGQADTISSALCGLAVAFGICGVIASLVAALVPEVEYGSADNMKRFRKFARMLGWVAAFSITGSVITPDSKTFGMMIVVPAIANSAPIQKDLPEIYNLAVEALKEKLAPKK